MPSESLTLERLGTRIWCSPADHDVDRPHLAAVVGERRTLMLDAGNSPAHARLFLDALADLALRPPDVLAITHWHWDHVFGASKIPALMVAHPLVGAQLAEMQTWAWDEASMAERVRTGREIEFCSAMIQKEMPSREGLRIRVPDLTIAGPATFDLGGVHCHLVPLPGDHGPDGMGLWVEEEDLLFVGDSLSPDAYHGPAHYTRAGLTGLIAALEAVPAGRMLHSHADELERREDVLAELNEALERL